MCGFLSARSASFSHAAESAGDGTDLGLASTVCNQLSFSSNFRSYSVACCVSFGPQWPIASLKAVWLFQPVEQSGLFQPCFGCCSRWAVSALSQTRLSRSSHATERLGHAIDSLRLFQPDTGCFSLVMVVKLRHC